MTGFSARTAVCMLAIILVAHVSGQESRVTPETLLRMMEARFESLNPCWVRYTIKSAQDTRFYPPPAGYHGAVGKWTEWEAEVEFAQDGLKRSNWINRQHPYAQHPEVPSFRIGNGEVTIWPSNQPKVYMLSKAQEEVYFLDVPWGVSGERNFLDSLRLWKQGKSRLTLKSTVVDFAGRSCLLVERKAESTGWSGKVWILPECGMVLRHDSYDHKGRLVNRWECLEAKEFHKTLFPAVARHEHFIPDEGVLGSRTECRLDSVEFDRRNFSPNLFEVAIPRDVSVWDNDKKVLVRNPELTQSHLQGALERIGSSWWPWSAWIWAGCFIGGFLMVIAAGAHQYRRNRKGARAIRSVQPPGSTTLEPGIEKQ